MCIPIYVQYIVCQRFVGIHTFYRSYPSFASSWYMQRTFSTTHTYTQIYIIYRYMLFTCRFNSTCSQLQININNHNCPLLTTIVTIIYIYNIQLHVHMHVYFPVWWFQLFIIICSIFGMVGWLTFLEKYQRVYNHQPGIPTNDCLRLLMMDIFSLSWLDIPIINVHH